MLYDDICFPMLAESRVIYVSVLWISVLSVEDCKKNIVPIFKKNLFNSTNLKK